MGLAATAPELALMAPTTPDGRTEGAEGVSGSQTPGVSSHPGSRARRSLASDPLRRDRVRIRRSGRMTHYCHRCYGECAHSSGRCPRCGGSIAAPPGTTYVDSLIWALGHPVSETAMIAARVLGMRAETAAAPALRALVDGPDAFLAAQALRSLIAIESEARLRPLLDRLAAGGPALLARVARDARAEATQHAGAGGGR